jgi:hypothetical protein
MNISNFSNTVLIVVFNFSHHAHNISFYKNIYLQYFKKIIFYSDLPKINNSDDNNEINFINIQQGCHVQNVIFDFFCKYKNLVNEIDGLFYIMDDCIINTRLLNKYSPDKLIFRYNIPESIDKLPKGGGWDSAKLIMKSIMNDPNIINTPNAINKFCNGFADYLYLPKKYFCESVINLFYYFCIHKLFLEFAIPSIISFLAPNKSDYNIYTAHDYNRTLITDKEQFYKLFEFNLLVHPIKLDLDPKYKYWLNDILINNNISVHKKCIVITTINKPTPEILHYSMITDWDLIIVADEKTDILSYKDIKCIFLGLQQQQILFPTIYDKIPKNSYARKMFGYLYAIKNKYSIIYDTDDDNKYIGNINDFNICDKSMITKNTGFVNIYTIFTDLPIWQRGTPWEYINNAPVLEYDYHDTSSIIQGLVNGDPDIDAYCRMKNNKQINFEKNIDFDILLNKYTLSPFNSQNTFHFDPTMFYTLYLPISVSFRYTDILRSYISLFQLWKNNKTIKFVGPNAFSKRNEHDITKDFQDEIEMYSSLEKVTTILNNNKNADIVDIYKILFDNNIVGQQDLDTLNEWMKLITD